MSYLQYFGLKKNPFSLTPDPGFLFLTEKHREALAGLLFAVTHRKGFMVLTGEAGTGKTTLVQKLLLSTPMTRAQFSVIVNPALSRAELLETILMDFGEREIPASKPLRLVLLKNLLLRAQREGKTSVLVVDEAHLLQGELLEEVRLLSNLETTEHKLLQIVLAGQDELNSVLNSTAMRPVRQRIAVKMHIDPLTDAEVRRYLQTRWARADSPRPLPFSEEAMRAIGQISGGIPRLVNVICDAALVNAYGTGVTSVDGTQIEEVARDLGLGAITNGHSPMNGHAPVNGHAAVNGHVAVNGHAAVNGHPAVPRLAVEPAVPEFLPIERKQEVIAIPAALERYIPSKPESPRFWKIGTWFKPAQQRNQ